MKPRNAADAAAKVEVTYAGDAETYTLAPPEQFTVAASLAFKWYDEIEAGRKRIEHRDATPYWMDRFFRGDDKTPAAFVKFTRGYTSTNMTWTVARIDIDADNRQLHIHLGRRVA